MVSEVLMALPRAAGGFFIDCNLGDGGHTEAILRAVPAAQLMGIDLDMDALVRAEKRLERWSERLTLHHGNFADVAEIAEKRFSQNCAGILFDLGVSSAQLDTPERGFSFRFDAELDMRFDSQSELTAYDIVNHWSQPQLEEIISSFGGEPRARRVARGIVRNRRIETTRQLADIVSRSLNWPAESRNHPATRTFQALRIAVNSEMENLERGLSGAVSALSKGGRLVVISYHSVEDRLVKNFIRDSNASCVCPPLLPECQCDKSPSLRPINARVIKPSITEVRSNPRARSARMRVAQKL
jgi:16S rRNA (cytosine1402-N4)-methyltransferase